MEDGLTGLQGHAMFYVAMENVTEQERALTHPPREAVTSVWGQPLKRRTVTLDLVKVTKLSYFKI